MAKKAAEAQQLQLELHLLNQEMTKITEHMKQVQMQVEELNVTEETINEMPTLHKENEVLVPLSSGIFAKAKILDTKHAFINTGAQVFVDQPIKKTKELISEQKEKLEQYLEQLTIQLQQFYARAHEIQHSLEK